MIRKPPSPVKVGMKSDEVLKLRGRSRDHATSAAMWIKYGEVVAWTYADCTVVLQRTEKDGPYRVKAVLPVAEGVA